MAMAGCVSGHCRPGACSTGFALAQTALAKIVPKVDRSTTIVRAGHVEFTFAMVQASIPELCWTSSRPLGLKATFFVIGKKIVDGGTTAAALLRTKSRPRYSVQNHTYDHGRSPASRRKRSTDQKQMVKQSTVRPGRSSQAAAASDVVPPPYGDY
jgi:hypothetical protein